MLAGDNTLLVRIVGQLGVELEQVGYNLLFIALEVDVVGGFELVVSLDEVRKHPFVVGIVHISKSGVCITLSNIQYSLGTFLYP